MFGKGNTKHGMFNTPTWKSWSEMKFRCGNPKRKDYQNITYCKEWEKFENFYRDMGKRPKGKTLDRIDVYGNYCKENCRWATPIEQANNKTNNHYFNYCGEKLTLSQIARKYGVSRSNLANKIYLYKMPIDEAMNYLLSKRRR